MVSLLLIAACGAEPAPAPEPAPIASPDAPSEATALLETEAAARRLGKALKTRLMEEAAQGPEKAVEFCSLQALPLTHTVKVETGIEVGRSSLKLRNPANEGPDWVTAWLAAQPADGASATPLKEVVDGQVRVVLPVTIEAGCLVCHGTTEQIPPGVQALLAERYPADTATGYAVGDLRGAIWASKPL